MSDAQYLPCPACDGTGHEDGDDLAECEPCKGTGEVCSECDAPALYIRDGVIYAGCGHI